MALAKLNIIYWFLKSVISAHVNAFQILSCLAVVSGEDESGLFDVCKEVTIENGKLIGRCQLRRMFLT